MTPNDPIAALKTILKLLRSSKDDFITEDFTGPEDEDEERTSPPEGMKKNKKKRGSKRRSLKKKMKKRKRSIDQCQTVCKDQSLS